MTTIVTRAGKGSPLTHTEVDTNFTNLNTAKLETAAIPLGTLQAPSVSFLNDSDTGIFCPQGGNSLAIATGAQYAITCTSTQAVGIKTANPQKALHVAGATRVGADDATDAFLEIGEGATGNRNSYIDIVGDTTYTDYGLRFIRNNTGANATSEIKHRGTGNLNFTTQEAGAIVFNTTNSPRVTILPAGNVGIGTSSPSELFNVATSSASDTTLIRLDGGSGIRQRFFPSSGTGRFNWQIAAQTNVDNGFEITPSSASGGSTFSTPAVTVKSDGKVGIGNTSPSRQLDVNSTAIFDSNGNGTTTSPSIAIGSSGVGFSYIGSQQLAFLTNSNERARIDSSGRLLVGTTTQVANVNGGILQLGSGITFPATAVAASDANTLDDYEEGTWTASITGGTFSSLSTGRYTKIGRQVFAHISPTTTAISGNLEISGLPFTSATRNSMVVATNPPAGITYIPVFVDTTVIYVNVSGTYSGGSISTYFACVYEV